MKVVAIGCKCAWHQKSTNKNICLYKIMRINITKSIPKMYISMKIDAEGNEITPVIILARFHEDLTIITGILHKSCLCSSNNNIKSEVRE